MIFQDPYGSLNPRMTRAADTERGAVRPSHAAEARDPCPRRRAAGAGAASSRRRRALPHEFSGGQRQRIGIARALAVEPECLIADELVSALDVSVQAQVINLLLELQERLHLTILFVAHDLRLVRHISHRVAVMYLGSVVEIGETEQLFTAPKHPYTQALLSAAPDMDPAGEAASSRRAASCRAPLRRPPAARSIRAARMPSIAAAWSGRI